MSFGAPRSEATPVSRTQPRDSRLKGWTCVQHIAEVTRSDEVLRDWLVSFDSKIVGRFAEVTEALAYADLLECSPRARRDAADA